jgi:hypothetical protein
MKLPQMYPNFLSLSEEQRTQFIEIYSEQRYRDLDVVISQPKTPRPKSPSIPKLKAGKITVTQDQFTLLKKLGLI